MGELSAVATFLQVVTSLGFGAVVWWDKIYTTPDEKKRHEAERDKMLTLFLAEVKEERASRERVASVFREMTREQRDECRQEMELLQKRCDRLETLIETLSRKPA